MALIVRFLSARTTAGLVVVACVKSAVISGSSRWTQDKAADLKVMKIFVVFE